MSFEDLKNKVGIDTDDLWVVIKQCKEEIVDRSLLPPRRRVKLVMDGSRNADGYLNHCYHLLLCLNNQMTVPGGMTAFFGTMIIESRIQ